MASGEGRVEAGLIRELCSADVFVFVGRLKVIMKIAQVAPLIESVPPRLYGGTERIVSYLTEELVRLGHDVTLFASGDSVTAAELAPCCTRALRLDATVRDSVPHFMLMIDKVRERAKEFDVFHFHIDFFHFPLFRSLAARTLTTLHGRQDLADLKPFYSRFGEMPLVSVSNDQRKPLSQANYVATVHHGIPPDLRIGRRLSRGATLPSWGGFRRKSARTARLE
jgi:glycosyltransferase involved in cell wall biosynthesis